MAQTTIAVDVMGGDNAPGVVIEGIRAALAQDPDLQILAVGLPEVVNALDIPRCTPVEATEIIDMAEHPANAVRKKRDSSIVVACKKVKGGEADGLFSAGSTGAVLCAATLFVGRLKHVIRPMLGTVIPTAEGQVLLCDVGANADCKPEYLLQFGLMGEVYMRSVFGIENPRVGLLNIGEEDTKGSQFALEANALMRAQLPSFVGNAQGSDILKGGFDVIAADGFTGNVCLKTLEGTSKFLFKTIKSTLMASLKSKIGALLIKSNLGGLKAQFSSDTYGGAPLIGIAGACVKGHGSSNALAVTNGILMAAKTARSGMNEVIAAGLDEIAAAAAAAETPAGADE